MRLAVVIAPVIAAVIAWGAPADAADPAGLPEIRLSERNRMPRCVTPEKLQRFLGDGNANLMPKFRDIARLYKEHGERLRVRWDYAFFQMVIETNYLKFENARGKGDVAPKQNNFAGIGTTGGGVPGDSFPDVSTGVLAQFQHLVAYSGERVAQPVATRTREKQDDIVQRSLALRRAVTFKDLAGRWAADRRYGTSIELIASRFRAAYCNGSEPEPAPDVRPTKPDEMVAAAGKPVRGKGGSRDDAIPGRAKAVSRETPVAAAADRARGGPAQVAAVATPLAAAKPSPQCAVLTASYGGQRNVLIRAVNDGETQYTALQVLDGQEQKLAMSFIKSHAAGGESLGEFANREAALARAFELCPTARTSQ